MRFFSVVTGFLLAIAVAYAHDASVAPTAADGRPQTIVNWDVFGRAAGEGGDWLRRQVDRLIDQLHGQR